MLTALKNYLKPNLPNRSLSEIKAFCQILFIDDQKFDVVEILKKAGWNHTKQISDVESLDSMDIINSHLLFVDIQGVGKILKFSDEGLGLIKALKTKYPTKPIIIYSAEKRGNRFHKGLSLADARLYKNADSFEFQSLVEKFSKESFSLPECVKRLKRAYEAESGNIVSDSEIEKKLISISRKGTVSESHIKALFNLNNASNLASIISLFLNPNP